MKISGLILLLVVHEVSLALPDSLITKTVEKPNEKSSHWRLTTRLHSKGMFFYTGRIISDNPVSDLHFIYDRKKWGFQVFKAIDLVDRNTDINFSMAVLYKNFKIGNRITLTPNAGMVLEQQKSIAGHGSDAVVIFNTAIKLNKHFTFDNAAIFGNLLLTHECNWTNRFRLLYSSRHVDATGFFWHNNNAFDHTGYASTGITVAYSRMKLSEHVSLSAGVSGLLMLTSSDEELFPMKRGVMFTMAMQLNN